MSFGSKPAKIARSTGLSATGATFLRSSRTKLMHNQLWRAPFPDGQVFTIRHSDVSRNGEYRKRVGVLPASPYALKGDPLWRIHVLPHMAAIGFAFCEISHHCLIGTARQTAKLRLKLHSVLVCNMTGALVGTQPKQKRPSKLKRRQAAETCSSPKDGTAMLHLGLHEGVGPS